MTHVCLGAALWEVIATMRRGKSIATRSLWRKRLSPSFKKADFVCPGAAGEQATSYLQPVPQRLSRGCVRLFVAQGNHGIHAAGAPGGKIGGEQRNATEQHRDQG